MIVSPRSERIALRASVAFVWIATAAGVLHPWYRAIGAWYLARVGLPAWVMPATCAGELLLGVAVARGPTTPALAALQGALVAGFTAILAMIDPLLLAHPFGVLTKNLPLLAVVGTSLLVEREGWSRRAARLLRAGVGIIWITEGLLPKILFQQPMELAVVAGSGLVPMDPALFLRGLGLAQALSGAAVLLIEGGRWLRWLLCAQAVALVALPALVSAQEPRLWVHPFGPLIKNAPILVGTLVLARRCSR